jgi:capsular exopolysaccharide synthesis family protein
MSCLFSVLTRRWVTFVTILGLGLVALALWNHLGSGSPPSGPDRDPSAPPSKLGPGEDPKKVDERLAALRLKLDALQLQGTSQEEALHDRERRLTAVNGSAADIERRIQETRGKQDRAHSRIKFLEADEHRFREALPVGNEADSLTSPVLEKVRSEMTKVRSEIAIQGLERAPGSPEYKKLSAQLAELEDSLRSELFRARSETIVRLKDSIRDWDDELRDLDEQRLQKMLEARSLAEDIRELSPVPAEIARVRKDIEDLEGPKRRPEGTSQEPVRLFSMTRHEDAPPFRIPFGWGLPAVVGLAVLGSFWRDYADPRVRTDGDIKRRLNLPVVALVEDAGNDPFLFRRHPQDPLSETMSTAATVVRSYMAEREFRTIAVTSAMAGEGKTTTAINLACALARKGLSVLLVDADLRAPRLHTVYGLDNTWGLSSLLLGPEPAEAEVDPDRLIIQTELPTLRLLPSGPTNEIAADLQDSPRMIDFIRTQRERFDVIVFDAAPLTGVGDAVALSRVVDTTLWVVRSGTSERRTLGWAKHLLSTVRADVAGVVLNFSPSSRGERFYTYPAAGA